MKVTKRNDLGESIDLMKRCTLPLMAWVVLTLMGLSAMPGNAAATSSEVTVTNRLSINGARKWSPKFWFGNLDEPNPPADYRPNDKHRVRSWYFRNPTHNLTFYVIGITDKT